VKSRQDEDFAEFERLYKLACKGDPSYLAIPIRDLYDLPVGSILRYASVGSTYVRQMPQPLAAASPGDEKRCRVLRQAAGIFVRDSLNNDLMLSGLPKPVSDLLNGDLEKQPFSAEQKAQLASLPNDLAAMKLRWSQLGVKDPMAIINDLTLGPVAKLVGADMVVALPDITVLAMAVPGGVSTIGEVLAKYSACITWRITDGAAVGCLTGIELANPTQARRSALKAFIDEVGKDGVIGTTVLAKYIADQRPGASESWIDAMMLVLAGIVIDQEHIGEYPYNIRLYTQFDRNDWAQLHSGKPFAASRLSGGAQKVLLDLLVQARSSVDKSHEDPAFWQTLDMARLTLTAEVEESPVIVGNTTLGGEVHDANSAGMDYEMRRHALGKEPLYQAATRRKLELTVASPVEGQKITTGFSDIDLGAGKPVAWKDLPKDLAAEFKKGIENASHIRSGDNGGNPPP
jgi:hypothetical protein